MRKLFILSGLLLLILAPVKAQSIFEQDAVLKNIKSQLPEGWSAEAKDKRIIFSRNDSIWVKHINRINAQVKKPNAEERIASFKKEGKKAKTMMSFRFEPRWSKDALKKAEEQNRKIFNQISKLPAKYKIEALYDSVLSEKGGDHYTAKTDNDKTQIKKYEEDRDKLMKTVVAVPFLHTEKYSLFPDIFSGTEDSFTDVYPEQASMEWYKVQNMITDLCKAR